MDSTIKNYEPVRSYTELHEKLMSYQTAYNESGASTTLDLVLCDVTVSHLARVARVLRCARGHALLVGCVGSGRRSLARLASFIAGHQIVDAPAARSYVVSTLLEDLKSVYYMAGGQGKQVTFILTDQSVADDNCMEYINCVLLGQIVPGLFQRDAIDDLMQELVPAMEKQFPDRPTSFDNLVQFFENRIVSNLHVVLCFSPTGDTLRHYALRYPGLLAGCTVDWYARWPKEALIAIADQHLHDFELLCSPEVKYQLSIYMAAAYDGVVDSCDSYFDRYQRSICMTIKSYLSFIGSYKSIYKQNEHSITSRVRQLADGMTKLKEASECVDAMKIELEEKEQILQVHTDEVNGIMHRIELQEADAELIRAQVKDSKYKAQLIVDDIEADKIVANEKFESSDSLLDEAFSIVAGIGDDEIEALSKVRQAPESIARIMDCIVILFQRKISPVVMNADDEFIRPSWRESVKLLSSGAMLESLRHFPVDTINAETIELLRPYLEVDDGLSTAAGTYSNMESLSQWINIMVQYFEHNQQVLPIKATLLMSMTEQMLTGRLACFSRKVRR